VNVPFLELARRTASVRDEIDAALGEALSQSRFVFGPQVEEFESAFAGFCGARHAVGVASGTDALELALRAVGVVSGDEVITAANTCVPTVAAIESAGAHPVLVDVDEQTFTLDPAALEYVVTERTKAIVPVHLYGQCADMEAITVFAAARGLKVVEDAAQAHGAEVGGARAGTFGDAAAFSFYPTKNLGAFGDAGVIVTNDPDIDRRARLLRNYGEARRYDSVEPGRNSRLDTIQAAVLLAQLPHLERWIERRRELAARYRSLVVDADLALPVEAPSRRHVYHLFVARTAHRDSLRASLARDGIETLVHYPRPIHEHPAYTHLRREGLEISKRLSGEIVSLPLYPELRDSELEAVAAAVLARR
jgi:dTDP-3-amino-3,4,6-trideoxy-alpha-D-glucose transaminase